MDRASPVSHVAYQFRKLKEGELAIAFRFLALKHVEVFWRLGFKGNTAYATKGNATICSST